MEKAVFIDKFKENQRIEKEYLKELYNQPLNKSSGWLNFIAFFLPLVGLLMGFYNMRRRPKRAKGIFISCLISLILQIAFFIFCEMFLFNYLGNICITLFG